MPKISIIMPVYNKQDYIQRSLDSVLNQDFSDFELIAIDDGSTDNSLKVLKEYERKDSRIRVIHTENQGVSHARNMGLDNCEGEYLTFVDADDELEPEYLQNLYDSLVFNDADIVIQGITKVFPDGSERDIVGNYDTGKYKFSDLIMAFADIQKRTGIFGFCVSKLFPIELCRDVRFNEELSLAEDFDYYLRVYPNVKTIYLDRRSYYRYYQGLAGSSAEKKDEEIDYLAQLNVLLRYKQFLVEMDGYSGNNQIIVEQQIASCAYNVLLYSGNIRFIENAGYIQKNMSTLNGLQGMGAFKKLTLKCVYRGHYGLCKVLFVLYRAARAVKRAVL